MIMPTIYLICLSLILSPITLILLVQNINFYKYKNAIAKLSKESRGQPVEYKTLYNVSQIYIQTHEWHKAIIILDNLILERSTTKITESAKCYNSIGIILQKNSYKNMAIRYYQKATELDSNYTSAIKNLASISKNI
uniref:Uncharacterized protein n=1 Tax=Helminthora furcellata TaxID=1884666 RepID=A0A1G4NQZ7_9FLOR|nr:Hypothetical protein ycf37 [Helminthora furcellata]SCW21071.1 Hypothetical protein ycf37 [Helminthora furcellata]SCW23931.1 Hypothetical protein ycf37 [Helminthora furcellata]